VLVRRRRRSPGRCRATRRPTSCARADSTCLRRSGGPGPARPRCCCSPLHAHTILVPPGYGPAPRLSSPVAPRSRPIPAATRTDRTITRPGLPQSVWPHQRSLPSREPAWSTPLEPRYLRDRPGWRCRWTLPARPARRPPPRAQRQAAGTGRWPFAPTKDATCSRVLTAASPSSPAAFPASASAGTPT